MTTKVMVDAHGEVTRLDIHEVVRRLNSHLGATAVAALAGSRDSKLPYRWAKADGPEPNTAAQERLRAAHRAWIVVADAESDHVARVWFLGANPLLDEESPVLALRADRIKDVLDAAAGFVSGTRHG